MRPIHTIVTRDTLLTLCARARGPPGIFRGDTEVHTEPDTSTCMHVALHTQPQPVTTSAPLTRRSRGHQVVPCDRGVSLTFSLMCTRAKMQEHAALSFSLPPSLSHARLPPAPPLTPAFWFQNMTLTCVFWDVAKGRAQRACSG